MKIWLDKYIENIDTTIDRYVWLLTTIKNDIDMKIEVEKTVFILNNHKLLLQASKNGDHIKLQN